MSVRNSSWEGHITSAPVVAKQIGKMFLGSCADQASLEALRAEVIRVALWAQSVYKQGSSFSDAAVTTRKILDQARTWWSPVQEDAYLESTTTAKIQTSDDESQPEEYLQPGRELLADLAEQGDLYALGEGQWLPAPLRLVPLTQARYLLVGGMPTHLLAAEMLHALHLHGSFRHVESSTIATLYQHTGQAVQWQFQSLESWLGPSVPTLAELVGIFDAQKLYPVSHQDISGVSFEAYAAYIDKPQYQRWQSLDRVIDGYYLLRTRSLWGLRQYSIGIISNRRMVKQSQTLHHIDIRRLCYALDERWKKSTRVLWNAKHGHLTLNSELPARERKLLSSIGVLQENVDSYYPRHWVNIKHSDALIPQLEELGIQIEII